ncbi:NifB/NifX family molybdenum-iron cluster-binding protein [Halanaeroarchaeum sulfurireducens]|uniref:Dinitrogenase iron-molybdenum cofactor biosynthesis protein n=1 Tax=Halanaeroarchaeum sulfurireducens TaxID=1604004 RepID=A0A0F7P8D0_9EURY|nr:NifB/NifX family molybdenum-iron cluster-binding protein [Halanaeroarchaeum sulfurireducens]AKH96997.1 dinitrogenase iron-molybdenum cofactor biosynthesis protein [Halanaeroarchaeum sulfurireducens]ALG81398.1 dinitrogenase iron-molybdenum cofactor biosynthesis protein [Halanaeroarchaeum sulfurireducens]
MRVCVPTTDDAGLDAELSEHFGRAPFYTIADTETDAVETVENESDHRGGTKLPPTFVADLDVDAVIVTDIGRRSATRFAQRDIEMYQASSGTVADLRDRFADGALHQLDVDDAHDHSHRGENHDH